MPRHLIRNFGTCLNSAGAATIAAVTSAPWSTAKTNLSMGAWYKSPNYKTNRQLIITNGNGSVAGYGLYISGDVTTDGSVYILNHNVAWNTCGFKVQDNVWHHYFLTIGASNDVTVYVDGVSRYTGTPTLGTPSGLSGFFNDGTVVTRGKVDDGRYYSSTLTADQVTNLYYGIEPPVTPTNWYKFDEGSGTSGTDSGSSPKTLGASGNTFPSYSSDVFMTSRTAVS